MNNYHKKTRLDPVDNCLPNKELIEWCGYLDLEDAHIDSTWM